MLGKMLNNLRCSFFSLASHIFVAFAALEWLLLDNYGCLANMAIPIQPDNIFLGQSPPSSSSPHQPPSFRSLLLNQKLSSLYVGARGHFYRLWLYNINDTSSPTLYSHREFTIRPEEREECLRLGNTERECAFWVRQIFQRGDGNLLLCSSQAMKPQLGPVDGQSLADLQEPRTQIGICSQHDGLNTTAVYTEEGNPEGLSAIYSGIRTGLSLENNLIYRPPLMSPAADREVQPALRTSIYDSNWLNEPQFVASFSIGPHVLFFFREQLSADCFNCPSSAGVGKGTVVSRVARVCKADLGGRQVLRQTWTSFVKARLNCSLAGFSFDQIQGVARVDWPDDSSSASASGPTGETTFYATFSAAEHTPFQAAAICAYSLSQINQLFDTGAFLEQSASGSGSWWNPTPADQVPQNRPGSCQPDSRQSSDEELHFAKSHLLMADQVQPIMGGQGGGQQPLFHRRSMQLTQIVADPLRNTGGSEEQQQQGSLGQQQGQEDHQQAVLLFAYSPSHNSLLKVLHRPNEAASSNLVAIYRLPSQERVQQMVVLPGEYLYMASESRVSQYRLGQCAAYSERCAQCVRDPYCSWSIARRECFPKESAHSTAVGWLAGGQPAEEAGQRCAKWARPKVMRVFPGDSVHLECLEADMEGDGGAIHQWAHNGKTVLPMESSSGTAGRIIFDQAGGIVLLHVSELQAGTWTCRTVGGGGTAEPLALAEYALTVDGEDCARPKSVEQFHAVQREWCRRMDAYRSNLSKWQSLYETVGGDGGGGDCPVLPSNSNSEQLANTF